MSKGNRVKLEHRVEELEKRVKQLENERAKKGGKLSKAFKTILNIAATAKTVKFIMDLLEWFT